MKPHIPVSVDAGSDAFSASSFPSPLSSGLSSLAFLSSDDLVLGQPGIHSAKLRHSDCVA